MTSLASIATLLIGLVVIPGATAATAHPSPAAPAALAAPDAAAMPAANRTSGQRSGRKHKARCPAFPGADQFSTTIDTPLMPLAPGTTFTYRETENGGETQNDVVNVTSETKTILGVSTVVVHDVASLPDGTPVEDTLDWYAQDRAGNVWYFGEDTKEFKNGHVVSTKGSWEAGVKGAMPGIVMEADSRVGDVYRQECAHRQAADVANVLNLSTSVSVPFGSFDHALETEETSRLDPGVVERKQYAPCIGFVRSELVKGGKEVAELVDVQPPPSGSGCGSAVSGKSAAGGGQAIAGDRRAIQRKSKIRPRP
ncbi:MAG TPA: hypothetical protein VFQ80_14130 [Thermomicrobiales bacterium]|nr:hypothetical protein [Thermomicrobiales bacterium]